MIEQILNMLKLTDHFNQSENIEIAKGKHILYKNLKDLYKQEKRKTNSKNS